MPAARYVIINADDFGYNEAVTQGILKGYREGLVTSTTAMVNIEGALERIVAAHAQEPGLPIGLHLNLTAGRPILSADAVPHLVRDDGTFYPFEELLLRLPLIPLCEVRAELNAQAQSLRATGIDFDHIDYHQQVLALYTPFFRIVGELAERYQVPVRQPSLAPIRRKTKPAGSQHQVRMILGFLARALVRHPARTLRLMIQIMNTTERKRIANQVGTTDWFVGAFFHQPTLENFCAMIQQLPPGVSEIMTHPAMDAPELYTMAEGYREPRLHELTVLLDPRARMEVEQAGIHLTSFQRLKEVHFASATSSGQAPLERI